MEMVQDRQILIVHTIIVHIANDYGYKNLHFWANPQKYQTLVPAKNNHLKVNMHTQYTHTHNIHKHTHAHVCTHIPPRHVRTHTHTHTHTHVCLCPPGQVSL